ncbi:MAG: Flp pilus assembly complex ATPase component TadA [Verrucomicrobia bacterium]|nr:Flp pilus assembly complex ATPase component TadA [Verrucomicrobiota bacterium]
MGILKIMGGGYKGEQFEIRGGCVTIGSSVDCELYIPSSKVSSRHAQLFVDEKVWWLRDLGTITGTVLKKRRIQQTRIQDGDEFSIAEYRFLFADSDELLKQRDEATIEETRRSLHGKLVQELDLKRLSAIQMEDRLLRRRASDALDRLLKSHQQNLPLQCDLEALKKAILDSALGLGPLEDLLSDPEVTEIMVNAPHKIYVERKGHGGFVKVPQSFLGKEEILTAIERIVGGIGKRIDQSSPTVDARLKDGSRVHAIIPPLALDSPTITIRKFPAKPMGIEELIRGGSLSRQMSKFLEVCVLAKKNLIVSGGTGSGKTTLLNVLSSFIPESERVITIEDSAELRLRQDHVVRLETRPANIEGGGQVTIRDLVRNALRMRPHRIIVGECRGGEALDMLQAMNTGHDGSLTTLHANSPPDALRRLENLVLFAAESLPLKAIRELIFSAVHIVVQAAQLPDGRRKITAISEITTIHDGDIVLEDIFCLRRRAAGADGKTGRFHSATGVIPGFIEEATESGIKVDMSMFVPLGEV